MRRTVRTGLAAGVLACLLSLTACDFVTTDTEGLLEKPTLNARQAEVYRALGETMNLDEIIYRRPGRGEYRSSFLFYDMDGDGSDEAIVFYTRANETQSTWTKLLREDDDGSWSTVEDFPVISDQIDFVRFSRLLSGGVCMLVGWQPPLTRNNRAAESFLGVYSYLDGEFTTEIDRQTYLDYTVGDFDGDSLEEIVTVGREGGSGYQISLLRSIGRRIAVASTLSLSPDAESVLRISTGSLGGGLGALYFDEQRADLSYATEVIQADRNGLSVLAGGAEPPETEEASPVWSNYAFTFREEPFLCQDIEGDGRIEIPATSVSLPGDLDDWRTAPIRLTPYLVMTAAGFDVKANAVVNREESYLVLYPDKWQNKVVVQQTDEADEWRFYVVDPDTGEPAVELLRILAYSANIADAEHPDEIVLGSRGTRHFTGYIPNTENEPAAITERELHEMFLLPG